MNRNLKRALVLAALTVPAGAWVLQEQARRIFGVSVDALGPQSEAARAASISSLYAKKFITDFARDTRADGPAPTRYAAPSQAFEPSSVHREAPALDPNGWTDTRKDALSTFAADVDTASYTLARRLLRDGALPERSQVRPEEFVNAVSYRYEAPTEGPFAVHTDLAPMPGSSTRHLLRIGVQTRRLTATERKPLHLVFLVDVSGSMNGPDRLPLAKRTMSRMLENLGENDTVALVTYAGSNRVVLESTPGTQRDVISGAIDSLSATGATAMESGMVLAYRLAARQVRSGHLSRVVVMTDGDANIGATSHDAILEAVSGHVREGVTLSTFGFGSGNYRDGLLEQLADKGDGNASYVDSDDQSERLAGPEFDGLMNVVARDVKLQVEFSPQAVRRYRLVGYENRNVADNDFRKDDVDAGEVGAGHAVTALYEVELTGEGSTFGSVRIRARDVEGKAPAKELGFEFGRKALHARLADAPPSMRLAAAAGLLGEQLRGNGVIATEELEALMANLPSGREGTELQELTKRYLSLKGQMAAR